MIIELFNWAMEREIYLGDDEAMAMVVEQRAREGRRCEWGRNNVEKKEESNGNEMK